MPSIRSPDVASSYPTRYRYHPGCLCWHAVEIGARVSRAFPHLLEQAALQAWTDPATYTSLSDDVMIVNNLRFEYEDDDGQVAFERIR